MPASPVVSVVIGSFERGKFLRGTIATVREELDDVAHEILVVDGGSSDGTVDWLVRQKDVITIVQHNRGEWRGKPIERRSWGYFMNLAFKAAQGTFVCMLSDDCLVVPGAIRNAISVFERESAAGKQVGGVAFYFRDWPGERDYRVGRTWGDRMFVNHGLYRRDALQAVGYADETTYAFYHADGDLSLRMWEADYACIDSPNSFIEHRSHTNVAVRNTNRSVQKNDWAAYAGKWASLGEPTHDRTARAFVDPHSTAERHWSWKRRIPRPLRSLIRTVLGRGTEPARV